MKAYAGKYKISGLGIVVEYKLEDGVLIFSVEGQPDAEIKPESDSVFNYPDLEASVKFLDDESGKVINAVHSQGGGEFELIPIEPYDPSVEELEAFTGKFYSKELETFYTLEIKDSTLMLLIRNTKEITLSPLEENSFKGDVFFISEMEFLRDDSGQVNAFKVSNGRTRNIHFKKI